MAYPRFRGRIERSGPARRTADGHAALRPEGPGPRAAERGRARQSGNQWALLFVIRKRKAPPAGRGWEGLLLSGLHNVIQLVRGPSSGNEKEEQRRQVTGMAGRGKGAPRRGELGRRRSPRPTGRRGTKSRGLAAPRASLLTPAFLQPAAAPCRCQCSSGSSPAGRACAGQACASSIDLSKLLTPTSPPLLFVRLGALRYHRDNDDMFSSKREAKGRGHGRTEDARGLARLWLLPRPNDMQQGWRDIKGVSAM